MSDSQYTRMTREEIAEEQVGKTSISRTMAYALLGAFLATILSVPVTQHWIEVRTGFAEKGHWVWPKAYDALRIPGNAVKAFDDPAHHGFWDRFQAANSSFMRGVKAYEKALEEDSFVARASLPPTQAMTAEFLGLGNEQVYLGRDGWLFYQPEVGYLTGEGFLNTNVLRSRSRTGHAGEALVQPNPVKAIVDFNAQLRDQGIHLIMMPAPVKPMIEPERLSKRYHEPLPIPLQNASYGEFLRQLKAAGVDMLDVSPALAQAKLASGEPQFLTTDTHWTPGAMDMAAGLLAEHARGLGLLDGPGLTLTRSNQPVSNTGDIAAMLKLPADSHLYPKQSVIVQPVWNGNAPFQPDPAAQILVLGDSFSNIYSLEAMGWGASAGFVEQLAHHLGRPVDAILRNDAAAFATRELLAKELAQGKDRLAGKKIVVWEFAMRELGVGNWKMIPLKLGGKRETGMYIPAAGKTVEVRGVVRAASTAPRPGSVPYKDHIVMLHLANLESPDDPAAAGREAVVFVWSMQDNNPTPAARLRSGDTVKLSLRRWADVTAKYEAINRSELEDETLLLAEPNWGEPLK
ncbi:MAG: hypothetical protein K8R57_04515 [Verrucomicrobia bacterium]|nr:hypothetical protein [Verrucomicrobiota bacterium]